MQSLCAIVAFGIAVDSSMSDFVVVIFESGLVLMLPKPEDDADMLSLVTDSVGLLNDLPTLDLPRALLVESQMAQLQQLLLSVANAR